MAAFMAAMLSLGIAAGTVGAKADGLVPVDASSGLNLYTLSQGGYLKLTGRAIPNSAGYLETDFSSSGFEVIINAPAATTFQLTVSSNPSGSDAKGRYTIYVDEEFHSFITDRASNVTVSQAISAGQHTIRVVKEAIVGYGVTDYSRMNSIKFNGTVVGPAPNKPLYIEVIGDSIACGAHSDFPYWPGTVGSTPQNHYVTDSFAYSIANHLNADVNVVAKGGIGLWMTNTQEPVVGKVRMQDLYPYSGYRTRNLGQLYDFSNERKPDLIVVELSPNDGNSLEIRDAWVEEAKKFILFLKNAHGQDVPIVWWVTSTSDRLYHGLRTAIAEDPELTVYDDLYVMTSTYDQNGGAALVTQKYGHPDAGDYALMGDFIYEFIKTEGVIFDKLQQVEASSDQVYYVSADGSDANDGLTPATALQTVHAVMGKLSGPFAADARLVIEVSGTVELTDTQELLGLTEAGRLLRSDGTALPVLIETKDFDGSNQAVLTLPHAPSGSDDTAIYAFQPLTLKNVTLSATGVNGSYGIDRVFAEGNRLVLDNVRFASALSKSLSVYGNVFADRAYLADAISGTAEVTSEVIFKNGVYDASTGFGTIAAVGGSGYIAGTPDRITAAPGLTCRIQIAEGGWLSDAKILSSANLTLKKAEIEVSTKGTLDSTAIANHYFVGTATGSYSTRKAFHTEVSFKITGGHVRGGFVQLGNFTTADSVSFTMDGGEIYVPAGSTSYLSSVTIGGANNSSTVNGNVTNTFRNGLIYLEAGSAQASVYLAGRNASNIYGTVTNHIDGTSFLIVKSTDNATIDAKTGIYFGMQAGSIKTELKNIVVHGLFNTQNVDRDVVFGAESSNSAIRKITNVLGVQTGTERCVGPKFITRMTMFGGSYGQIGVSERSTAAVAETPISEVVLSTTIYGASIYIGSATFMPYYADDSTRVMGSVENMFVNPRVLTSVFRTSVANAPIYGHVKNVFDGGIYQGNSGVGSMTGTVYGGLEYIFNDYHDFNRATSTEHPFTFAFGGTIKGTETVPALSVTINGGTFHGALALKNAAATVDGDIEVSVNGGWMKSFNGGTAEGFITGGHFKVEPAAASLAANRMITAGTFANTDELKDVDTYGYEIGVEEETVVVEIYSQSTRGDVSFADLQGGGVYKKGSKYTITAPDIENFNFLGWYTTGGARASKNKTYSSTANEDVTRIAKYELIDNLAILKVTADAFELTSNGETTDETGTITKYLPAGTAVTLRYTDGTKPFIAWLNGSDKIIGTNGNNYSFTLCVDSEIKASTSEAGAFNVLVMFENEYNQLLSTQYVEQGAAAIEMPTPPQRLGRTLGWDKDAAAILAEIQGGADTVTVKAIVTARTDDTYTVNVNHVLEGAEGTEISENVVSAKVGAGVLVEALEELSGKPFMYVKLGDEIISYERTFPFKANADTILTAVYGDSAVEKAPLVTMTIALRRDNGDGATDFVSFTALRVIPEDCEVISQGFLVTQDASIGGKASAFIYGANGVKTAVAKDTTKADITTVNMQKAPKGTAVYGRAFVVIRDGNGVQSTIYSEIVGL